MSEAQLQNNSSIDEWAEQLVSTVFPVFPETNESLRFLSDDDVESSVDRFCSNILYDPGGVIAILSRANSGRKGRLGSNVSTVENAAMMIGVKNMRNLTENHPQIDLPVSTESEKGYMRIVARAYHVAYQAYDWAICRGDMVPKEVYVAAFLHDLGAMALWLSAPDKMKATHELKWEKQVPDDEAQYVILGFSQEQLGQKLALELGLPGFVIDCMSSEDARNPRVQIVKLASQMVHLSETHWYSDEMCECQESIAELLDISFDDVVKRTHKNAIEVARETGFYGVSQSASLLPMTSGEWPNVVGGGKKDEEDGKHFCLMPQTFMYDAAISSLKSSIGSDIDINHLVVIAQAALHDGLGLNRVVFALLSRDKTRLEGRYIVGADSDPVFSNFNIEVDMGRKDLFTQLLQKPRSIWLSKGNRDKIWPLISGKFKELVNIEEFYAMSVFARGKPVGIFYADRHLKDIYLDARSYESFKRVCSLVSKVLDPK